MGIFRKYELQFFTATILEWKMLLKPEKYKSNIIDSLKFLSIENRICVHAFVIMNNHIHLLWHIKAPHTLENVQRDFLKYTAQHIRFDLSIHHPEVLPHFLVNAKDRKYQFWERNSLSIDIHNGAVLRQKLNYIHENPVRAGLAPRAVDYPYSSASFYDTGDDLFGFLVSPF